MKYHQKNSLRSKTWNIIRRRVCCWSSSSRHGSSCPRMSKGWNSSTLTYKSKIFNTFLNLLKYDSKNFIIIKFNFDHPHIFWWSIIFVCLNPLSSRNWIEGIVLRLSLRFLKKLKTVRKMKLSLIDMEGEKLFKKVGNYSFNKHCLFITSH